MRLAILPRSLAGRTILMLLAGFMLVQLLGLGIHTVTQVKIARIEQQREIATQDVIIYRHIAAAPADERAEVMASEPIPAGDSITLSNAPPSPVTTFQLPFPARQILRASIIGYGIPLALRPHGLEFRGVGHPFRYVISFALPDGSGPFNHAFGGLPQMPPPPDEHAAAGLPPMGQPHIGPPPTGTQPMGPPVFGRQLGGPRKPLVWLTITTPITTPQPWRSPEFGAAFIVMMVLGAAMIFWAVRQLLVPVKTLAQAAERLGRDVANAPDLPETGPEELAIAAAAFNTMASRIRRFVEDRTFLLTAIGHDLRTPITRLKLRAEYMEDDEQRVKMLADLDEMEAMVAATLAFGRDVTNSEPLARIDLPSLLRTILDEAADGAPERAEDLLYEGPEHLAIKARPLSLKRALVNLVNNALKYGDAARIGLMQKDSASLVITIEDNGPGIPAAEVETVFEPFRRLETSRNRETGGSGLGLSIARNIIRAHGGDILLRNMAGSGLQVSITLPV